MTIGRMADVRRWAPFLPRQADRPATNLPNGQPYFQKRPVTKP